MSAPLTAFASYQYRTGPPCVHSHAARARPVDHVRIRQRPTKDIQRRADGEVDLAMAQSRDELEIRERARAAGVGDGERRPFPEGGDQIGLDAGLLAFDVDGVDEELVAMM